MAVELRRVEDEADGRFDAYINGRRIALLRVRNADMALRTVVIPDPGTEYGVDDVTELLEELSTHARGEGVESLVVDSPSVFVRALGRHLGFQGGLRDPLVRRLDAEPLQRPVHDEAALPPDWRYQGGLAEALNSFGIVAAARRRRNPLSRLGQRFASGVAASIELSVEWLPGRSFSMAVPDRSDLMEEAVARCADTAVSILRRFRPPAALVREIRFDRSDRGLTEGIQSGHARGQVHTIHLNVAHCAAYAALELREKVKTASPDRARSGGVGFPYAPIDATVAHEVWHLIENDFEVTRYSESVEFRRALGHALGVMTLEQAVKGDHPKARESWKHARNRLVQEVSSYGATKVGEATAEMFKAWWCRTGATTPIVARFGELIEEYFPTQS